MTTCDLTASRAEGMSVVAINAAYAASRALSKWFHRGVRVHSDGFERVPLSQVEQLAGDADSPIVAVHLPLCGELRGHVLLTMSPDVAGSLARLLTGEPPGGGLTAMHESALQETGNIVGSAFTGSLTAWLRADAHPGPPALIQDLAGAVLGQAMVDQAGASDTCLLARTTFLMDGLALDWNLFLLPSAETIRRIDLHAETPVQAENNLQTVAVNGAFHASRALSKWFRRGVRLETEGFQRAPLEDISRLVGDPEQVIFAVHMSIRGELGGHILLCFPEEAACRVADVLLEMPPGSTSAITELELSCLQETGNIVGSAFVNSLAGSLDVVAEPSPPQIMQDMACALLEPLLLEQAMHSDEALAAKTDFSMDGQSLHWQLFLLPDPDTMGRIERCLSS